MIEQFDSIILDWFQSIHTPALSHIFYWFTRMGEAGIVWIAIGIFMLLSKNTRKMGVVLLLALLFCLITGNLFLKNIVARPRPCWRNPEVEMLIPIPRDYSFPSGHTMSSFAAAFSIFMWNRRWGIVALAGAALISLSRLYFYVHYPTDVAAGVVIGIALALLAGYMTEKYAAYRVVKQRKE